MSPYNGMDKEEAFYNRSLERALQILNAFGVEHQNLSLAQIATALSLPRATVLRLCSTLVKYSFLHQDLESKRYSLGLRLFELGSLVFNSFSLRRIASHHLSELQLKLGKTIFLGVLDNDDLLYIDKKDDARNVIRFTSEVGRRRPPNWGMVGPMILAYMPEDEVERILGRRPMMVTARKSLTTKEELLAWLREIRAKGYAVDEETAMDGISGVATPIKDASGKVIAAIGVAFISSSVDSRGLKRIIKESLTTALAISEEMGYMGTM
ncbi:MAG TPA: IclR family transcriptional regulator [Syntrophorhabdaceae bacterium]